MKTFRLKNTVGWGNEIHIETANGTYAGSGRCITKNDGIQYLKPSFDELKKDVNTSGFCSNPKIKNGDILIYETDQDVEVKFKFRSIEYYEDPKDMFKGKLKLVNDNETSFINKILSWL